MPCRLRVKVYEARDLPVMDRKTNLTDAYVEVQFDDKSEKTDVVKHSLNPVWNKAFRFDVTDDKSLQDSPLEILVWDYDLVGNDISIGTVYVDMNPLLNADSTRSISGWFPIFDTLQGIRGEIKIKVRLEFFRDANDFGESSAGVMFFSMSAPLALYEVEGVLGFAEELVVEDDPEYHWTDSFRASRTSNSEREYLLYQLAGKLRRQIGKKVRDLGGNAILGYRHHFDMIEKSIIARGIGTAAVLTKKQEAPESSAELTTAAEEKRRQRSEKHKKKRREREREKRAARRSSPREISSSSESEEHENTRRRERKKSTDRMPTSPPPRAKKGKKRREKRERERDKEKEKEREKEKEKDREREREKERERDKDSSSSSSERDAPSPQHKKSGSRRHRDDSSSSSSSSSEEAPRRRSKGDLKRRASAQADSDSDSSSSSSSSSSGSSSSSSSSSSERPTRSHRRGKKEKEKEKDKDRDKEKDKRAQSAASLPIAAQPLSSSPRVASPRLDTPPATSLPDEAGALVTTPSAAPVPPQPITAKEVKLVTMRLFPSEVRIRFGGVVAARAVKLLKSGDNIDDYNDSWWSEVREEIKAHALALQCDHVIGYTETTSIEEDLILLSAVGTAASLKFPFLNVPPAMLAKSALKNVLAESAAAQSAVVASPLRRASLSKKRSKPSPCAACHIPYSQSNPPFPMQLTMCLICKKKFVPEVLFATVEPPADVLVSGPGRLLEARVCRLKKPQDGDVNATTVSDAIPFLEYDLHQQLMYKLKLYGMNAIFSVSFQLTVGDDLLVAVASGTAVFLPALPAPPLLHINRELKDDSKKASGKNLIELEHRIMRLSELHRERISAAPALLYPDLTSAHIEHGQPALDGSNGNDSDSSGSGDEKKDRKRSSSDGSDATTRPAAASGEASASFVVEVDDELDEANMAVLLDPEVPEGFHLCTTELLPGAQQRPLANLQLLTAIRRVEWDVKEKHANQELARLFNSMYTSILFKFRELAPVCITSLTTDVQTPDTSSIELIVTAIAVLQQRVVTRSISKVASTTEPDPLFAIELDSKKDIGSNLINRSDSTASPLRASNELTALLTSGHKRLIELTPSSYIPGARTQRYIGRISLHLIKERMTFKDKEAEYAEGGLGLFTHELIIEAQSILRAHVAALGGNALFSFKIDELRVNENTDSNNRGYCLISISGDVAAVKREKPTRSKQSRRSDGAT